MTSDGRVNRSHRPRPASAFGPVFASLVFGDHDDDHDDDDDDDEGGCSGDDVGGDARDDDDDAAADG